MTLSLDEYGDGIGDAWTVISDHTTRTRPDTPVPTCPEWTLRDLVAHQGMVHRWAAATLRHQRVDSAALEEEGRLAPDQRQWFDDGVTDLLQAIVDAPEDLDCWFFLADPPPPRLAWARRQCHETTVHAVDAMSATFGRAPTREQTWIRPSVAADGIDELLTGFLPRPTGRLRTDAPHRVRVETTDTGHAWTMTVSADPVVTDRGSADADTVLRGPAVGVYLALWNRGDEVVEDGRPFLAGWRRHAPVRWS